MKKLLSVVMSFFVLTFVMWTPITSSAAKSNHDFVVKNMGKYSKDMKGISKFFKEHKDFNVEDAEKDFVVKSSKDDNLGYKHIKLQQVVDGVPVFGNEYVIHYNQNDEIYAVNGVYDVKAKLFKKNKDLLKEKEAAAIAMSQVQFDADSFNTELPDNGVPKLYLYDLNGEYVPVYLVRINYLSPTIGNWYIFVNAYNGEIVNKYNQAPSAAVTGTGKGVLGDTKTLNLDMVTIKIRKTTQTQYQLVDKTRPATVNTYTASYGTRIPGSIVYSTTNVVNDPAAVDAHYYAGIVYDYYKAKFNRLGIDNRNMAMNSTVHYGRNYNNAGWTGTQMVYGDGDGTVFAPLSGALDVIGHEMTHGVNSYEADLVYQDQSGALSESFSDCMGTFIEYYAQSNKFDWQCGEDIYTPKTAGDALRDLQDPTKYGDPAHMNNYLYTTQDYGGVHTNCGIPNKACYLAFTKINDMAKMEQIYYRALCNYLTSTSQFTDARKALIQAATDLYGANSAEVNAFIYAYDSVGVY